MLIGGRIMTVDEPTEEQPVAGPSSDQVQIEVTPKLNHKYFDQEMCYAPPKKLGKSRIEICETLLPVPESPMSPPDHERGPSLDTPPDAAYRGWFPRVVPCAEHKAVREREQ